MKNLILFFLAMCLITEVTGQIVVATNGYVGINNTNPGYNLDVTGMVQFTLSGNYIRFTQGNFYPSPSSICLGSYGNMWAQLWAVQPYFTYQPVILSDITLKKGSS